MRTETILALLAGAFIGYVAAKALGRGATSPPPYVRVPPRRGTPGPGRPGWAYPIAPRKPPRASPPVAPRPQPPKGKKIVILNP